MLDHQYYCEYSLNSFENLISQLNSQNPFIIFDLNFDKNETTCLLELNINTTSEYNNYGNLENLDSGIKDFIFSLGNNLEKSEFASSIITKLIHNLSFAAKKGSACVFMKSALPNDLFDMPRWHIDGRFFSLKSDSLQYKIVTTLKGDSTLFYPVDDKAREEFNAIHTNNLNSIRNQDGSVEYEKLLRVSEENRKVLASKLDLANAISNQEGQAAIFVVGSDFAAIHSEPAIKSPRLFLSILPATKEEAEELRVRYKAESLL